MLAWFACAAFALGQGSQLPKYTVATLPAASSQPHYIVQAIDCESSTICVTGGGANNVALVNVAGVWHALGSVSPTFTGTVTVNAAPTYSVYIGPLGTMTASWNFDTTTAATACASLGCATGGGTVTSFAAPSVSWPAWLVPTVTNPTSAPSLAVAASSTGSGSVVLATSPALTGTPTTPTASTGTNTTQIATAALVLNDIANVGTVSFSPGSSSVLGSGGSYSAPTCASGFTCTGTNGLVSFTTGNSPSSTGAIFAMTFSVAKSANSICTYQMINGTTISGTWPLLSMDAGVASTTVSQVLLITSNPGPFSANQLYTIMYICGR
jgi:hypothetical protein